MQDKLLVIVRGLPGSGKTTIAETLSRITGDKRVFPISADDYFYDTDGNYNFDANQLGLAHTACFQRVSDLMLKQQEIIVVANTFTSEKELQPYIDLAKTKGYTYTVLLVENRHGNESVHGVPDEAMDRMRDKLSNSIKIG